MITPSFSPTATERVLPKLALDFTTASLDPRVTFTRTTDATHPATYTNSSGYVTAATNNQPRFDYDPVTLTCKGLLIEESRSNLAAYSSDYTATSDWTRARLSAAASATVSPDGITTSNKLIEDTATNSHLIYKAYTYTSGVAYTASVYAKKGERNFVWICFPNANGFDANYGIAVNLTTGEISSSPVTLPTSYSVKNVGNGWWRISITATTNATTGRVAYVGISDSLEVFKSYTGDGTSGIYVWGYQLEAGAFATSYIPTTTTALTRNADVATMTGTNFSSWYNTSQGSFVIKWDFVGVGPTGGFVLGTNTAHRVVYTPSNPRTYDGTTVVNSGVSPATGSTNVACSTYGATTATIACNGAATVSGSYNGVAATTTAIQFMTNYSSSNNYTNGHLYKLFYYPQQLTAAEVRAFSKG